MVGLRLSAETWSVDREHFPRLAPRFWSFCGMGPLTRSVAGAREVVDALAPALRQKDPRPEIDPDRVLLYAPDAAHRGVWPSFEADALSLLEHAGVRVDRAHALPPPGQVSAVFDRYLCAHFLDFIGQEELALGEGVLAALAGLLTRGKLDKRIHPASGALFAIAGAGRLVYRDADRQTRALERLRESVRDVWRSGRLIVAPTTTSLPPRHGRAVLALRAPTFAKLGNLVDATALALPFGRFAGTALPRSLQIVGPPGSEREVLDLAARLEREARS